MELKFYDSGIACYESQKLGCKNAFFTRLGGVSHGSTASLNLAFGRGDDRDTVLRNLALCAEAKDFSAEDVISCPQIHSTEILTVNESHRGLGYFRESDVSCDGYITDKNRIVLGVKTADCVPILMSAKKDGKVVAVAAVHAGWRGSVNGIAPKAAEKLMALAGVSPNAVFIAIGPSASSCCYEVGEEVYAEASENFGAVRADKYFYAKSNGKYMVDLKGFNASLLYSLGIPYENMDISEMCTICEERYFYSHRRDGDDRGTHLNIITID